MKRPIGSCPRRSTRRCVRSGYTLVEILVATGLMAVILTALTAMLARVTETIGNSRSTLETAERLRGASHRLAQDLEGLTVTTLPPRDPSSSEGVLVVTEGPVGPMNLPTDVAFNLNFPGTPDSSAGDTDDILHFTTRSDGEPFVGRANLPFYRDDPSSPGTAISWNPEVIESDVAEVIWFVRGNTLYRRQLIVLPSFDRNRRADSPGADVLYPIPNPLSAFQETPAGFYNYCDLSVHWDDVKGTLVGNSLGDLTKPENRFAYDWRPGLPSAATPGGFPHHPHLAGDWYKLRMPTLQECSHPTWAAGGTLPAIVLDQSTAGVFDPWLNPNVYVEQDTDTGTLGVYVADPPRRVGGDVVLTNVLSFDVKVWDPDAPLVPQTLLSGEVVTLVPGDPGYVQAFLATGGDPANYVGRGAYVDLNYLDQPTNTLATPSTSRFSGRSRWIVNGASVYDTWSTHYEHDGVDQGGLLPIADEGSNGFDDNNTNGIDDPTEAEGLAPYLEPLRGIQIKIRVFEPDSRVVREVTIVQDLQTK